MQANKILILMLVVLCHMTFTVARADVVELIAGFESGRFIEGVNLTANQYSASAAGEWSGDNGVYTSLSCFIGENAGRALIQRGCDGSIGWFTALSSRHAITLAASRHDYSSPVLVGWEYTDVSASWHFGKTTMLTLKGTDSLLGRGFSAVTASFHLSQPISDRWRMKFEAGVTSLQSSAPVSKLEYGILSAEYGHNRWVAEIKLQRGSKDYQRFVRLDHEQLEIAVNIRYRMY
jgi:hypothetical protein